jgi:DNA-directed RNA polymerase specialized sigma24 family protein
MKDRLLVPGLRLRDPRAIGAVHDAYAERLFAYCWSQLHSRGAAKLALRDTLIWAEAHAHELPRGTGLAPWLYSIARAECARRRLPGTLRPDVPPARHDQDDALPRVLAWRAVAGLPPLSRELLDLRHRHGLAPKDIATVVGRSARDVAKLLGRGRALLEEAVVAEILAGGGPFECAGRTAVLRRGELDGELRASLLRHSRECATCRRRVPRSVSVSKVYGLLPRPAPPRSSRSQVIRSLTDPAMAGYRLRAALREAEPRRRPPAHRSRIRAAAAVLFAATVTSAWLAQADGDPPGAVPAPRPALDARPAAAPSVVPEGLE